MATITKRIPIAAGPDRAWAALRDVGNPHRAFAGVLTDARLDGDRRVVTFANGMVVTEQIVTVDDHDRRLAYTVLDGPFTHHHASFAVTDGPNGGRDGDVGDRPAARRRRPDGGGPHGPGRRRPGRHPGMLSR